MDPISAIGLVSSVVQLIDATTKVISYVNAIRNGPRERADFGRHASSLLTLLFDLQDRVDKIGSNSDPWFSSLHGLGADSGPLAQLKDQMERLAEKLERPNGKLKALGKALTWTLDKKEIEEVLGQIERVKTLVMFALQNDQFKLSLSMKEDLSKIQQDVHETRIQFLGGDKNAQFKNILGWLSSPNFAARQADFLKRQEPGTGEWLLSASVFQGWLQGRDRILWCPGLPGAGKTTLASMVIHWLETQYPSSSDAILYLFCDYKEEQTQRAENLVISLFKQVLQRKGVVPKDVETLYNRHGHSHPRLEHITPLLLRELRSFSQVFVVIDALDECPDRDDGRRRLLAEIQKLPQDSHILITSRYAPKIEEDFRDVPAIDIRATDSDVKHYVKSRVEREPKLAKHVRSDQGLMDEITVTILQNCRGMFLLAQLHMDNLSRKLTRREVRLALRTLPKELDDTYNQALHRIEDQEEDQATLAHRVLYWTSYTLRPLSLAELQHALAVYPGDRYLDAEGIYEAETMISVCAGLVTLDEESDQIRLVHHTTQSYFDRNRDARYPGALSTMARTCLTYLALSPFSERYCINYSDLSNRLEEYPFLEYAARNWGHHARHGMDSQVHHVVMEYFKNPMNMLSTSQVLNDAVRSSVDDPLEHGAATWSSQAPITCPVVTPLHVASLYGLVDIGRCLIENGADVNARQDVELTMYHSSSRRAAALTPLHIAAAQGHTPVVRMLLRAGAEPSPLAGIPPDLLLARTPLCMAVEQGHISTVHALLEAGGECAGSKTLTTSPLVFAALENRVDVARILIEYGAHVSQDRADPARAACAPPATPVQPGTHVEQRIDTSGSQARAYLSDPWWSLAEKGRSGNISKMSVLLDHGADLGLSDECATALHVAVAAGQHEVANLLLSSGFGIHSRAGINGQTALHVAARYRRVEMAQRLLATDIDVSAVDNDGNTPLHYAILAGDTGMIERLLNHKAYIPTQKGPDQSAVDAAVEKGDRAVLRRLLRNRNRDEQLNELLACLDLQDAVTSRDGEKASSLLQRGVDPNAFKVRRHPWAPSFRSMVFRNGKRELSDTVRQVSLLHLAVLERDGNMLQLLLEHGAVSDATRDLRNTLLHWATCQGYESEVRVLLEHGAESNSEGMGGLTPLHIAVNEVNISLVQLLLQKGAEVNAKDRAGTTPLAYLFYHRPHLGRSRYWPSASSLRKGRRPRGVEDDVSRKPLAIFDLLVEQGADPEKGHRPGAPALVEAVRGPLEDTLPKGLAERLLDRGADVAERDLDGFSALYIAARRGLVETTRLLLEHGAGVEERYAIRNTFKSTRDGTPLGHTVLHAAAASSSLPTVELLVDAGADPEALDDEGNTALHYAVTSRRPLQQSLPIVEFLLGRGLDINARYGPKKATVLHHVPALEYAELVPHLIRRGASTSVRDIDGRIPLDWAKEWADKFLEDPAVDGGFAATIVRVLTPAGAKTKTQGPSHTCIQLLA